MQNATSYVVGPVQPNRSLVEPNKEKRIQKGVQGFSATDLLARLAMLTESKALQKVFLSNRINMDKLTLLQFDTVVGQSTM